MFSVEEFRSQASGKMLISENLGRHTTLRIGGDADYFFIPETKKDVVQSIRYFDKIRMPYVLLGRGSNMLVSDQGVRGVVISLRDTLNKVSMLDGNIVYVEAGVDLPAIALKLIKRGYGGLEMLSGVPGSVGGAVLMNAGAYGCEIFDCIESVEIVRKGEEKILKTSQIDYGYRHTNLENDIILSCKLLMKRLTNAEIICLLEKRKLIMEKRRRSQPLNLPNAGSIFKNPPVRKDVGVKFAGELIEACGLKGVRIGDALVSETHANFIVNAGNAKAKDVLMLIDVVTEKVRKVCGIELELEIKLVGFDDVMFKR